MIFSTGIFRKSVEEIQVSLKSDKNNRHFTRIRMYVYGNFSPNSAKNEKYFRQKLYRKSKHTFHVQQLFSKKGVIYEIKWENLVEQTGYR